MHNYVTRRDDGWAAAERFTGVPQRNLFEYVLVRMPDLARPRVSAGAVMIH